MITLSNRYTFDYLISSGAWGDVGRGWWYDQPWFALGLMKRRPFAVVTKSVSRFPMKGNRSFKDWFGVGCVRFIPDGVVNAVGLTNDGFHVWFDKVKRYVRPNDWRLIPSLYGSTEDLVYMIDRLNQSGLPFVALQINMSCPNTGPGLLGTEDALIRLRVLKGTSSYPIIAKLSVAQDCVAIVKGGKPEAVELNSVPWKIMFPNDRSPLEHIPNSNGGGVSGKVAQKFTWPLIERLAKECPEVPVIGGNIWEYLDIARVRLIGAKAVSFGSVHIPNPRKISTWLNPTKPTRWVLQDIQDMNEWEEDLDEE